MAKGTAAATEARELAATPPTGLAAAEAIARRARGLGNDAPEKGGRSYPQIVVENAFTFTNNIMFLLGVGLVIDQLAGGYPGAQP